MAQNTAPMASERAANCAARAAGTSDALSGGGGDPAMEIRMPQGGLWL